MWCGDGRARLPYVTKPTKMKVTIKPITTWQRVANAARLTIGKTPIDHEPSTAFRRSMILAEHSPIRLLEFDIIIEDIPMWLTTHFVRHKIGVEPFVRTQREDRNDAVVDRDSLPQGSLNTMQLSLNAQALINISRKRLCFKAHKKATMLMMAIKSEMQNIDPIMADAMQPNCIYCGFCREMQPCGFADSDSFDERLKSYRRR